MTVTHLFSLTLHAGVKMSMLQFFILSLTITLTSCELKPAEGKFFYFAYGSNMLKRRLLIENPVAEFYSSARLEDYRLDFVTDMPRWNGAVATVCPDPGWVVWGALWLMDIADMKYIDHQEGVYKGLYIPKNVLVWTPAGERILARLYVQTHVPTKIMPGEYIPLDRLPSITYLKTLVYGAIESGLPQDYIEILKTLPTNGALAPLKLRRILGPQFLD